MKKTIVIGIIGKKGSGKGTVADYLVKKFKANKYYSSGILRGILEVLNLPPTREHLIDIVLILKKRFGKTVVMNAIMANIDKDEPAVAIVDSLRMKGDVVAFKKRYGENFYCVYIDADVETRYKRTKKRKEKTGEDKATFEEFLKEERRRTERSIGTIGKKADFVLDNNDDFDNLMRQVKEMVVKLTKIINKP